MIEQYEKPNGRIGVRTINNEPSLVQEQFKEETDINNIMAQYAEKGILPPLNQRPGAYADLTNVPDYQGMLDQVLAADAAFNSLPASTRSRFDNDPQKLIDFLGDKNNLEEAVKLKLIDPKPNDKPNDEPKKVEPVTPPASS